MYTKIIIKGMYGKKFSQMAPFDSLSCATIRIDARKQIFQIIKGLDQIYKFTPNFLFAYELIDIRELQYKFPSQSPGYICQIVAFQKICEDSFKGILEAIPRITFLQSKCYRIIDYYHYLSGIPFRLYNRLFFDRIQLEYEHLSEAKNVFTRMQTYQNVLCMSNLDDEEEFMKTKRYNNTLMKKITKNPQRDTDEQRKIQMTLYGNFRKTVQIYLPPKLREIVFQFADQKRRMKIAGTYIKGFEFILQENRIRSEDQQFVLELFRTMKGKEREELHRDCKIQKSDQQEYYAEDDHFRSRQKR